MKPDEFRAFLQDVGFGTRINAALAEARERGLLADPDDPVRAGVDEIERKREGVA
jgi:hypothetical protein